MAKLDLGAIDTLVVGNQTIQRKSEVRRLGFARCNTEVKSAIVLPMMGESRCTLSICRASIQHLKHFCLRVF